MKYVAIGATLIILTFMFMKIVVEPEIQAAKIPAEVRQAMVLEGAEQARLLEAERMERARNWEENLSRLTMAMMLVMAGALGLGVSLGVLWLARQVWKPRVYYAENGLYPIIERDRTPLVKRVRGEREVAIANPNQIASPFTMLHVGRDGGMKVEHDLGGQSAEQVAQSHRTQAMAQMVQAGYRGKVDRREASPPNVERKMLAAPQMTLREAIEQSSVKDGLIVGFREGRTLDWTMEKQPHAGILGSTGQGKTTGATTTIVLEAIKAGVHVIVLDKEGSYWPVLAQHVEYVETDGDKIQGQLEDVATYMGKVDAYMRQNGISHFVQIGGGSPRVLVVVEEFADLCDEAGSAEFVRLMELFARRGSKYGINFMLVSQHHDRWPKPVRQNISFIVSYNQPVSDYSIAHYYEIDHLEPGEFAHKGQVYRSWDTSKELMGILAELPRFRYRRIVQGASHHGGSVVRFGSVVPAEGGGGNGSVTVEKLRTWTDKQAAAVKYIEQEPGCTQSELRRALGVSKGYGFELWHKFHPQGKRRVTS